MACLTCPDLDAVGAKFVTGGALSKLLAPRAGFGLGNGAVGVKAPRGDLELALAASAGARGSRGSGTTTPAPRRGRAGRAGAAAAPDTIKASIAGEASPGNASAAQLLFSFVTPIEDAARRGPARMPATSCAASSSPADWRFSLALQSSML